MVYLRGYNSNKMNKLYQNNGFVKQQTAGYQLQSKNILWILAKND